MEKNPLRIKSAFTNPSAGVPIWARQKSGVAFADIPIRSGGRIPEFCIIGAAKAGTSALNEILSHHPSIFMNPLKEPNFFSTEAILSYGEAWYRGLYADAKPYQLCGEASTSYTRYPLVKGTAERLALANPEMKLIYLLREPVARVEADCLQLWKYIENVLETSIDERSLDDFFEAIEVPDDPRYAALIPTSRYIDQIDAFEAFFPREQFLILFQDDLKRNPDAIILQICNFLGVEAMETVPKIKANVTADFIKGLERVRKTEQLKRFPFYEIAKKLLPSSVKNRILDHLPGRTLEGELRFGDEMRVRLEDDFREPNQRLKERLGYLPQDWSI